MEEETIKCKNCRKLLKDTDMDWFLMTNIRICTKCENKELDEQGDRLDKLYDELSKE